MPNKAFSTFLAGSISRKVPPDLATRWLKRSGKKNHHKWKLETLKPLRYGHENAHLSTNFEVSAEISRCEPLFRTAMTGRVSGGTISEITFVSLRRKTANTLFDVVFEPEEW